MLYTGVRIAGLVAIRLTDIADLLPIRITTTARAAKAGTCRSAPLRETLALHITTARADDAVFLLESPWKKPHSIRGVGAVRGAGDKLRGLDRILAQPSARSRHGVPAEWICGANPVTVSRFDTSCSLPSSLGIASPAGTAIADSRLNADMAKASAALSNSTTRRARRPGSANQVSRRFHQARWSRILTQISTTGRPHRNQ